MTDATQTDEFTITDTFDQPGLWYAVAADEDGFVDAWGNLLYDEHTALDDVTISVVKDTALPVKSGRDFRMPGTYNPDDVAVEFDEIDNGEDFRQRWLDAVAIAESRNARQAPEGNDR